jgi:hypothetical protein
LNGNWPMLSPHKIAGALPFSRSVCAKGPDLYRLLKNSAFGWRSASTAAVTKPRSSANVNRLAHITLRFGWTPNGSRRRAASAIQSPSVGKTFKPGLARKQTPRHRSLPCQAPSKPCARHFPARGRIPAPEDCADRRWPPRGRGEPGSGVVCRKNRLRNDQFDPPMR